MIINEKFYLKNLNINSDKKFKTPQKEKNLNF